MTSVKRKNPHLRRQPHRDKLDIIKDILSTVAETEPLYRNRRNQTSVGYAAYLTHPQTVRFLKGLIDEGLLTLTKSRPSSYYEITPKGQRCLQVFAEREDDLRPLLLSKLLQKLL
jgi:predicted transcriptional regulator